MSEFARCLDCARHVRVGERCPFCGATRAEVGVSRLVSRRDFTRAAVVAGAAVLAGCGGPEDETDEGSTSTSGGENANANANANANDDATATDEAPPPPDPELEEEPDWRRRRGGRCDPVAGCPPYGAPPSPETIV